MIRPPMIRRLPIRPDRSPPSGGGGGRAAGFFAALAAASHRRGLLVLAIWLVLAAAGVAASVHWLKVDTNPARMINPRLPFRAGYERLVKAFPQLDNGFLALIEASDPDAMRAAARAVEQSFRARPRLFSHVFAPALSPMFEDYGALWLTPEEVRDMVTRLRAAAPLLSALAASPNLPGLADLIASLTPAATLGRAPPMLGGFFDRLSETVTGCVQGRAAVFDWEKLGGARRSAPGRYVVFAKPQLDFSSLDPAAAAMEEARRIVNDPEITGRGKVRVRLTGEAAMNAEEFSTITKGAALAGLASFLFVTLVMVLGLPARRLVIPALALVVLGFAVNAGFATLAVGELNMISVAFAVLFIGLGVDYAVHFLLRWAELARGGAAPAAALASASASTGPALALSAVTTMFGFLAFTPTDFTGMAQLGVIAAGGMAIALAATLTLVPAVLGMLPLPARWAALPPRRRRLFPAWARGAAAALVALLAAASVFLAPKARFDGDPVNLKDPAAPSVIAFNRLLADEPGLVYSLSALAKDARAAAALAARLEALPQVREVRTAASFIPPRQAEKLAMLRGLAGALPRRVNFRPAAGNTARLRALSGAARNLRKIMNAPAAPRELRAAAARLRAAIELFLAERGGKAQNVSRLETAIFIRLPDLLARLNRLASARALSVRDMDPALRSWYIAPDGRWRLEIVPAAALTTEAAMRDFVSAVRGVVPGAAGAPAEITGAADVVSHAMLTATLTALAVVVVIVLAVMRSFLATLLVLAPIVLSALLLTGYTVLFDAPFNFANVIVIPLLLGLGVDSAIHYVHRAAEERSGGAVAATSTSRAVIISALTTIGSFGTLWLTPHRGMSSMGELLTVSIVFILLTTLIVLPWLIDRAAGGGGLDRGGKGGA